VAFSYPPCELLLQEEAAMLPGHQRQITVILSADNKEAGEMMKSNPLNPLWFIGLTLVFVLSLAVPVAAASETKKPPEVRVHVKTKLKAGVSHEDAIQAFEKLMDYFTTNFQPENGYMGIEKTSEGIILHLFVDYKSITAYGTASSRYARSKEWLIRWGNTINLYCEGGYQYAAYFSTASLRLEKPVSDLSQGQEGKIFFTSINLGSFREILAGKGESKPTTIFGTLKIPKGVKGKVSAVIILHGIGGVNDHYFEVANMLNEMGVAGFVVDSFRPRGVNGIALAKSGFHSYAIRISDAYAALELLSTHPKIDRNKIAVLGFSHGGAVALFASSEKIRHSFIADDLHFVASIAYYPPCGTQFKNIDFTDAPILMLLAEKDNMAPIAGCLKYAERIKESGADVKVVVYKGTHHQFPVLPGDELIKVSNLPDWSRCGMEHLIFLRDDGTCFFPHTNKTVDEVNAIDGEYTADCRIDGGAIVGGNEEAKRESIKEYQNLLREVFNID